MNIAESWTDTGYWTFVWLFSHGSKDWWDKTKPKSMSEMGDRVERAIEKAAYLWLECNYPKSWRQDGDLGEIPFYVHALAAIKAMREPTQEMLSAAPGNASFMRTCWQAMVDAARGKKVPE